LYTEAEWDYKEKLNKKTQNEIYTNKLHKATNGMLPVLC